MDVSTLDADNVEGHNNVQEEQAKSFVKRPTKKKRFGKKKHEHGNRNGNDNEDGVGDEKKKKGGGTMEARVNVKKRFGKQLTVGNDRSMSSGLMSAREFRGTKLELEFERRMSGGGVGSGGGGGGGAERKRRERMLSGGL
eukprot:TRINITY_DN1487_c1_g1_i1.p2 TRINITY_DN1487_c1_g1~~TRINITY_DN1487_c1_g1_i1.p2  ORF type:complete len:158 (-),score=66.74 TRINITY_DN1487_c1_g1_i1:142-561(-)